MSILLIVLAVVGHLGLHVAIYNRLNATGLRRPLIKRISKLILASCLAIPLVFAYTITRHTDWLRLPLEEIVFAHPLLLGYVALCFLSVVLLGIPWLMWRPLFRLESVSASRTVKVVHVGTVVQDTLAISMKCRWLAKLPCNQIFHLAVEQIDLSVRDLPAAIEGLRIAHLSDLHFTGDVSSAYVAHVIAEANDWQPDMYVITGDIIDKEACIAWLPAACGAATSKLGNYFILGNHDKRVPDPNVTRRELQRCGWIDVGGRVVQLTIGHEAIEIIGNEFPWFPAPAVAETPINETVPFRLLLSHSPDQIWWARARGIKLMLAGHTHGGQGRLPLVGPLLGPSWSGSRFASGDFYKAPTTMHVSRGLGGVHLLRLNCRPELSLLTLRGLK